MGGSGKDRSGQTPSRLVVFAEVDRADLVRARQRRPFAAQRGPARDGARDPQNWRRGTALLCALVATAGRLTEPSMPPPSLPTATIRTQVLLPLRFADGYATTARVFSFSGLFDGEEHLAFGLGDRASPLSSGGSGQVPLVRPHSECLTGDVFGSQRCDCGAQLREAVERIADSGGYLLYLRQEGRASGCTPSSTPTRCRTPGSIPMKRTSRWGTERTSAAIWSPRRCSGRWV